MSGMFIGARLPSGTVPFGIVDTKVAKHTSNVCRCIYVPFIDFVRVPLMYRAMSEVRSVGQQQ